MRALVRDRGGVSLRDVPPPGVRSPGEAVVEVALAGICRTDLSVAEGRIPAPEPLVLGHELAGTVVAVSRDVRVRARVQVGQRVACMPVLPCGACATCRAGDRWHCPRAGMLGLTQDGGFAEQVVLPAANLLPLPDTLDWRRGAYLEPVAAALGVLEAGLSPRERGAILGEGRIAALTLRVLRAGGFAHVTQRSAEAPLAADEEASLDFVVESRADAAALDLATRLLRPGGTLVLKSRPAAPVPVDLSRCVRRRLRLVGVAYGDPAAALDLLTSGRLEVADLLGEVAPLDDHARLFAAAAAGEATKLFVQPTAGAAVGV